MRYRPLRLNVKVDSGFSTRVVASVVLGGFLFIGNLFPFVGLVGCGVGVVGYGACDLYGLGNESPTV